MTASIPKSRRFWVFFCLNSKYEGKYAIVEASSLLNAELIACNTYGFGNIGSITRNEEYAKNKIEAYELTEVTNGKKLLPN